MALGEQIQTEKMMVSSQKLTVGMKSGAKT